MRADGGGEARPRRIVSLLPGATEIICALDMGDHLVGRSHECDFPAEVERLPSCTEPKFRPDGTSHDIEASARALLREGLSVYRVQAERLEALRPDVIVTQEQCEVCAATAEDVKEAVRNCLDPAPEIVALDPRDLQSVWADMESVAAALGVPARGTALVKRLRERMDEVALGAATLAPALPAVAVVEWIEPLMSGGNWFPELVTMAGGAPLFGKPGAHSPWLDREALVEADPDVILVVPCGFILRRVREELPKLAAIPGWSDLTAVARGRVFLADGHHYFNRPGPRLAESLEILAEILHPELFDFGHEGRGWERIAMEPSAPLR